MSSLSEKRFRGFWPPILIETRPDGRIDLDAVTASTEHFIRSGVHGLYTADTASEFYTMEFEEWNELVTHFRSITRASRIPVGVGCTWTNQAGVLRRIARARELGFDNIHLSQPYWIRLNEPSQRIYWSAVAEVAGTLPILVYAGSQGQFPLDGPTMRRLSKLCPSIIGTKSSGFDSVATDSLVLQCPDLLHFVHETVLCHWMALGAVGCFSSLVALCPALALRWFDLIARGDWPAAHEIQIRVNRFYEDGVVPIRKAGYIADKAVFELARVPGATRVQRAPYASVPGDLYRALEAAAVRNLPEFTTELGARGIQI